MKVIVAGCRWITSGPMVRRAIEESRFHVSEVVSGGQVTLDEHRKPIGGVDWLGEQWAAQNGIPMKRFTPDWDRHGRKAGPLRNRVMAVYADALIAVWDGESRGTASMIMEATARGLKVHVHRVARRGASARRGGTRSSTDRRTPK